MPRCNCSQLLGRRIAARWGDNAALLWRAEAKLARFVEGPNGDTPILGDKAHELLSNIFDVVVLLEASNVCWDRNLCRLADENR